MERVSMLPTIFWILKTVICCPRVFLGLVGIDSQHSLSLSRSCVLLSRSRVCTNISTSEAKQAKCPYLRIKEEKLKDNIKLIDKHNYATSYNKAEYILDFKQISNME